TNQNQRRPTQAILRAGIRRRKKESPIPNASRRTHRIHARLLRNPGHQNRPMELEKPKKERHNKSTQRKETPLHPKTSTGSLHKDVLNSFTWDSWRPKIQARPFWSGLFLFKPVLHKTTTHNGYAARNTRPGHRGTQPRPGPPLDRPPHKGAPPPTDRPPPNPGPAPP